MQDNLPTPRSLSNPAEEADKIIEKSQEDLYLTVEKMDRAVLIELGM
jgi:hypothetical protein